MELLPLSLLIAFVRSPNKLAPDSRDSIDRRKGGIRCPACGWRPARHDAWACAPGCGHVWNTFDTNGECPNCLKHWAETQCVQCGVWSRHEEWYEQEPDPDLGD